jgi:hypothetical protein
MAALHVPSTIHRGYVMGAKDIHKPRKNLGISQGRHGHGMAPLLVLHPRLGILLTMDLMTIPQYWHTITQKNKKQQHVCWSIDG